MGIFALCITLVCYLCVAVAYYLKGDYSLAWSFICYALANLGFIGTFLR